MNHEVISKQLERLEQKTYRTPAYHYPGEKYAYVFGITKGGRVFFDGPYAPSDPTVDRVCAKLKDSEIFYYDTRDLNAATRQIKAELLSRGEEPDEALKRMIHKKGLEREEKHSLVRSMFKVKLF